MTARIFQPAKTAMQSGAANTRLWVLEYVPQARRTVDPLMGYTSSADMQSQVKLEFSSREDAIAYAERNGIPFTVTEPQKRKPIRKSYSDNFKYGRIGSWTH